jgi:hypothetical protein
MIDISNVINISVSQPPAALAPWNVNNLALFTKDSPVGTPGAVAYYANSTAVATDWGTSSHVFAAATAIFSQSPNILSGGGVLVVIPMLGGETLTQAITRVKDTVYFGACSYDFSALAGEITAAASYCQSIRRMLFVVSSDSSDLTTGGLIYSLHGANESYARGLFYSASASAQAFKWGYAARGMSTNFAGSNTTQTQHLKQIIGVEADAGITQTLLTNAASVGADVYASIAGRPSVICNGANEFFDNVYNLTSFINDLEVALFNALATSSTKIPQTEKGVDSLKAAVIKVCRQYRANQFVAPGSWTGTDTFGDPEDFARNIEEQGFYIYSAPVAAQSSADRTARKAPLIQVALKYAGAVHSSSVIIYVNN